MQNSTESSPFTLEGQPIPLTERLLWSYAARPVRTISLVWALLRRLRWHLRRATVLALKTALIGSLLTPGVAYAGPPTPTGPEFRVNSFTTDTQRDPSIAMDADGDFIVTWTSSGQDGSGYGVYAQRYNAAGATLFGEFRVNTFTTVSQFRPSVAMDADGDFVVAWISSNQDGSSNGVYAQRYNAAGAAQGPEFRVNTFTTGGQFNLNVAMDADGDFVAAWNSYGQDGFFYGSYAQAYNAAGAPIGGEFRVNTFTTNNQAFPSVALDANGDFVVAWGSVGQDGSSYGVYAQRYTFLPKDVYLPLILK